MRKIIPLIQAEIKDGHLAGATQRAGQAIITKTPPSVRSLRRWISALESFGPLGLRKAYRHCGKSTPTFDPEIEVLMAQFARLYAAENRPTKKKLYGDLRDAVNKLNETRLRAGLKAASVPCDKSFHRRIAALPAFDVHAGRYGVEAARRKFWINNGGLSIERPGERVELDEWNISLQTLTINSGVWETLSPEQKLNVPRNRWWLSVAMDVASRCILGMQLSPTPTAALAVKTLKMAVSDKGHFADAVGALKPWDMHCSIETIAADMGSAYISDEFRLAVLSIGANLENPPGGLPQMRAHIERLFSTIHTQFISRFTGRTFENPVALGDYPAEKRASITTEELAGALVRYVVDAYHNSPHVGLGGETPGNCWRRLTKSYGTLPVPDKDTRRNVFGLRLTRTLDPSGVRFFNLHYQSPDLQKHRRNVGDCQVEIIVDEDDLGCISIKIGDGYLTVPCMRSGFHGVCIEVWRATCRDLGRRYGREAIIDEPIVRETLAGIQEMIDAGIKRADIGSTTLTAEELDRTERSLSISLSSTNHHHETEIRAHKDLLSDVIPATLARAPTPSPLQPSKISPTWDLTD